MKPNAPELRRVLAHIETHQDRWWQGIWRTDLSKLGDDSRAEEGRQMATCGTAFCFAGWKAELDGVRWASEAVAGFGIALDDTIILPDGRVTDACDYATEALGLAPAHARKLFRPDNTLEDLREIVAELCAEAEQVTP